MPELPEVETVRRGLEKWILGKRIEDVEVFHRRATRSNSLLPLTAIEGARITGLKRRGKFLWFVLDRDFALVGHLGMSGQMLVPKIGTPDESHLRVRIGLAKSSRELRFIDQRTFGWLGIDRLVETSFGDLPESCAHIAPDPFDDDFDMKSAIANIRGRKTEIKRALLNQEIVSGIGNIYADEALWRAKIHPERIANRLSAEEVGSVLRSAKSVMRAALKKGGTSFDDLYINVNGESGYFEISLQAYGCEGEPCSRCGAEIRRISFANRSSHFCPKCQPRGRKITGNRGSNSRKRRG